MREIKFRTWNSKFKNWIYPVIQIANNFNSEYYKHCKFSQFTGKHDKNGKEIYEGDIIKFDPNEWGGDDNIHVVTWDDHNAEWSWGGGGVSDMRFRKVIGNIYENPELIPK
jgi:hypothetical protein